MKRMVFGLLATLLASACLVSASFAAPVPVPYLGVQVGGTWVQDADIAVPLEPTSEAEFDTGFNVGITGGVDCGPGRYELELTYRQSDIDSMTQLGEISRFDGDISALALMANAFWDIETGGPVTPYLGGGIGFANVSINEFVDVTAPPFEPFADDDDTVFAYQLGVGMALELNPNMALDLGYRYFATSDPEFTGGSPAEGFFKVESEYRTHNASVGLRMMF